MSEFSRRVECPHCGHDQHETLSFNFMEADDHGCKSNLMEFECQNYDECGRKFWAKAYLEFQIDNIDTFQKKPKEKKK